MFQRLLNILFFIIYLRSWENYVLRTFPRYIFSKRARKEFLRRQTVIHVVHSNLSQFVFGGWSKKLIYSVIPSPNKTTSTYIFTLTAYLHLSHHLPPFFILVSKESLTHSTPSLTRARKMEENRNLLTIFFP